MKRNVVFLAWFCFVFLPLGMAEAWECEVTVSGPQTIKLNQKITLSASGTPDGGSYSWSRTPNLVPNGSTATLTGYKPEFSEYIRVMGYYTSPKGKKCTDTKWLWVCVCTLEEITGPAQAKVGEKVTLTTKADSEGGTYTWAINSGTGTLTPDETSATFIGDTAGTVEIKASYVPSEGGEPCTKYKTIQVQDPCSVYISGLEQRPVCRPEIMRVPVCHWVEIAPGPAAALLKVMTARQSEALPKTMTARQHMAIPLPALIPFL